MKSLEDLQKVGMDLSTHRSAHDSGGDRLNCGAKLDVTIRCGHHELGEPEIGHLCIEVVVEEDVACFDVAVEDGGIRSRVEV